MTQHVVVIGGGIGGAVAARDLARRGHRVTVVERSDRLGGLVVSFAIGGTPLECFYHHTFPHEHELHELIGEVGLSDRLEWLPSSVGVLHGGRLWPFTSPLDLLRFRPLPFLARIRTGAGALLLSRARRWRALDRVTARAWLRKACGDAAMRVVWDPLLRAKFGPAADDVPAAWMFGRFTQRRAAQQGGGEVLGYLRGGFVQLFDALAKELTDAGVDIRYGTSVTGLETTDGRVTGVVTDGGTITADAVLWTGPTTALATALADTHEGQTDPRWSAVDGLGVLCVVLELAKPISSTYWTNVCEDSLPFGGIIEHTNLLPVGDYGTHVAYLSRYFVHSEPIAAADPAEEAERWVDALIRQFPHLTRDDVLAVHPFRANYAAPLVRTGHLARIPPVRSEIDGLYVCTTSQIYPQDRGMSEGVRHATEAAAIVDADLVSAPGHRLCPACGADDLQPWFTPDPRRTEAGVDPESFTPSSSEFGTTVAPVQRCSACGHGVVDDVPTDDALLDAYVDAADPVSLAEEPGQLATGHATLATLERHVGHHIDGGMFVDVGAWTGSLLVAARERGWEVAGLEPSAWAVGRAAERGLTLVPKSWDDPEAQIAEPRSVSALAFCDVLEHLTDPLAALTWAKTLLRDDGALLITVPDAGSAMARALGRRWWSVLPMHLQYFTRESMTATLAQAGFKVVEIRTHPKTFSARYYGQQLADFAPVGSGLISALSSSADRLVTPDFGDRMLVIATRA